MKKRIKYFSNYLVLHTILYIRHHSTLYKFPMAAIAPRNSLRMQSQQGVFTICHRESIGIENVGAEGSSKDHIWKYIITPSAKKIFRKELKWLGINRFQLFPELESLSENLK
jgi:hypothetical protein